MWGGYGYDRRKMPLLDLLRIGILGEKREKLEEEHLIEAIKEIQSLQKQKESLDSRAQAAYDQHRNYETQSRNIERRIEKIAGGIFGTDLLEQQREKAQREAYMAEEAGRKIRKYEIFPPAPPPDPTPERVSPPKGSPEYAKWSADRAEEGMEK